MFSLTDFWVKIQEILVFSLSFGVNHIYLSWNQLLNYFCFFDVHSKTKAINYRLFYEVKVPNLDRFVCLFVYAGPRSCKYKLQPPVMGCPYAGILPQAQEQFGVQNISRYTVGKSMVQLKNFLFILTILPCRGHNFMVCHQFSWKNLKI